MKKSKLPLRALLFALLTTLMVFAFVGCSSDTSEIAGTYEMTSVSGTINNVAINESSYEYFRIIITDNGKGTVQSKASNGGTPYEAKGSCKYKDGKIYMTTGSGFQKVTEVYDYADGEITYSLDTDSMKFTIKFQRAMPQE